MNGPDEAGSDFSIRSFFSLHGKYTRKSNGQRTCVTKAHSLFGDVAPVERQVAHKLVVHGGLDDRCYSSRAVINAMPRATSFVAGRRSREQYHRVATGGDKACRQQSNDHDR